MTRPLVPVASDVAARLAGAPLLVLLDVDGTLAPIAPRPEEAAVPPSARHAVAALAALPDVHVAFVSGRAAADVARLTGVAATWIIGNHGYEIRRPNGRAMPHHGARDEREAIAAAAREVAAATAAMPGVIIENKDWTVSVHFRLADPELVPRLRALVEGAAAAHHVRVLEGKKVLEIRPLAPVHKGTAVLELVRDVLAGRPGAAVLYMGDDTTDEDAFASLRAAVPGAVTVRVTHGDAARTAAEFTVRDPDAVVSFLDWLAQRRGGSPPAP